VVLLNVMKDICGASEGMQLTSLRQKARVIENQDGELRNSLDSMEKTHEILQVCT
jgi:hypothetical protein